MKREKKKRVIITAFMLLFCLSFSFEISNAKAIDIFTNVYEGNLGPNESIDLNFLSFQKKIAISTDIDLNFNIKCLNPILKREMSMQINNTQPLMLNISLNLDILDFLTFFPDLPELEESNLEYKYNNIIKIVSNSTIANLTFSFERNVILGLNPLENYTMAYYSLGESEWELINTFLIQDNETSNSKLRGSLTDLEGGNEYYITLFDIEEDQEGPIDSPLIWIIIIGTIFSALLILGLIIVISKQDYFDFLKRRLTSIDKKHHRLSLEEVLENENRNSIIDLILKNPGIHFNEILRKTNLSPGNLVWHLDILETYKIIAKKRIMHYVSYFPYYQKNPISNLELKLQKSDLTLKILKLVKKNPGTWNSLITEKLKINRKTIAYHLAKLEELDLIKVEKEGRKKKIYPSEDLDDLISEDS